MRGRLIAGLLLLLVGTGLILDLQGYIHFGDLISKGWPLVLVVVGLVHLATRTRRPFGGLLLILIGAFFLLKNFGYLPKAWGAYFGALVLIFIGLVLLFSPRRRHGHWPGRGPNTWSQSDSSEERIHRSAVVGGFDERVHSRPFRGGSVDAFMGGGKIDLRDAELPPEGADLEANATLGGIEVIVPTSWRVEVSGSPFLGGIDNRTARPADPNAPVLRVKANAFLGGVDVKN
jgi:predicted membrane protein